MYADKPQHRHTVAARRIWLGRRGGRVYAGKPRRRRRAVARGRVRLGRRGGRVYIDRPRTPAQRLLRRAHAQQLRTLRPPAPAQPPVRRAVKAAGACTPINRNTGTLSPLGEFGRGGAAGAYALVSRNTSGALSLPWYIISLWYCFHGRLYCAKKDLSPFRASNPFLSCRGFFHSPCKYYSCQSFTFSCPASFWPKACTRPSSSRITWCVPLETISTALPLS